jgi:hypothetical protein
VVIDELFEETKYEDRKLWSDVIVKGSNAAYMVFTFRSTGKSKP